MSFLDRSTRVTWEGRGLYFRSCEVPRRLPRPGNGHQAVRALGQVVTEPSASQIWWGQPRWVRLEAIEDLLQGAALLLAQTVQLAAAAVASSNLLQLERMDEELSKAQAEIARADAKVADKQYDLAVLQYGQAWLHASFAASLGAQAKN